MDYYLANSNDSPTIEENLVGEINLNYAWYKDDVQEPNWALGIGAEYTSTGGAGSDVNPPKYYLVLVKRVGTTTTWQYARTVLLWNKEADGQGEKESLFSFEVNNELIKSWTNSSDIGQTNNPLYKKAVPNKIELKSGWTHVEKSLEIGSEEYELVFIDGKTLITSIKDYEILWRESGNPSSPLYLLNTFPTLRPYVPPMTATVSVYNNPSSTNKIKEYKNCFWQGTFPLWVRGDSNNSFVVLVSSSSEIVMYNNSSGAAEHSSSYIRITIDNFSGWVWKVKNLSVYNHERLYNHEEI